MGLTLLNEYVNIDDCPITESSFVNQCKERLEKHGALIIPGFLRKKALRKLIKEAKENQGKAFYSSSTHNIYLTPRDKSLPDDHIFNHQIISSKGCITTDQIPENSGLKIIYHSVLFKNFLSQIVQETSLFEYDDPFSSINIHYANEGQELGWHFDNSSFAVTLLLQKPLGGGTFEYVKDVRNSEYGDMGYETANKIVLGHETPSVLEIEPGTLVLFRGKDSMHRVTPTIGDLTRMLVVFAYNAKPGISLSKSAQKTFYGKVAHNN